LQIRTKTENLILWAMLDGKTKPKTLQGYLTFLIPELEQLFAGVTTYDAATGETFNMRAMLLFTQHDYVGLRDVALQTGAGNTPSVALCKLGAFYLHLCICVSLIASAGPILQGSTEKPKWADSSLHVLLYKC
jgi:hypothetical protein